MAVVLFQERGEIEALELGGLDQVKQRLQLLRLHVGQPVKIILADAVQQSGLRPFFRSKAPLEPSSAMLHRDELS